MSDMERVEWFHAVGRDMADLPKAIVLTNWQEAIRSEYSPEWEHILNVTSENFWIEVGALSSTRADEWNGLVDEIAPIALELVQRKVAHLELNDELRHKVIKSAKWDLQNTLMGAEYVDIHPPGFYMTYIINIYHKGHFPCGWIGDPPGGIPVKF